MKRMFVLTLTFLMLCSTIAHAGMGTRIMFIVEMEREKAILERDAGIIANTIGQAKSDDHIEAVTLEGKRVFCLNMKKRNVFERRKEKGVALSALRQFYLQHIKSPHGVGNADVAASLKRAIHRFNVEKPRDRYVIVFLSGGLHKTGVVDFTGGRYPSDSWVTHEASPFSVIPNSQTGKKVEVLFIPQPGDYVNTFHAQRIERFYALLLHKKKAQLVCFSDDHQTSFEIISRGVELQRIPPQPEYTDDGKLILYRVEREQTGYTEEVDVGGAMICRAESEEPGSIQTIGCESPVLTLVKAARARISVWPPPIIVSGSVFKLTVQEGTTNIWVSIRDPYGNPIEDLRREDFRIREIVNGQSMDIPPKKVKLERRSEKPLAAALVRDVSGSIDAEELKDSGVAIIAFLGRMDEDDIASLIDFGGRATVASNFSLNRGNIKNELYRPRWLALPGSAVYDALQEALLLTERMNAKYLKVVIGYTDGWDNMSKCSPNDVIEAARRYSIPVFLVGVGGAKETILRQIAVNSGGIYCAVSDTAGLRNVYRTLSDVLNKSYFLSYPTTAKCGDEMQVDIKVEFDRKGQDFLGHFWDGSNLW